MTEAAFVDPDDNPINAFAWGAMVENLGLAHIIAQTWLATPDGGLLLRTTWSGLVLPGVAQPYGTVTGPSNDGPWTEREQYSTRAAALAGHLHWIAELGARTPHPATEGPTMLVLTRRIGESIRVGDDIVVTFLETNSNGSIRLGISAPQDVPIHRDEVYRAITAATTEPPGSPQ